MLYLDFTNAFLNGFFYVMISFSFGMGTILMVSPRAFQDLNQALQKEYGLKKRLVPKFEDTKIEVIDQILIKNTVLTGMVISVSSFMILMMYK